MRRNPQKLKRGFRRNVCIGLVLFLLAVIAAGCASFPPSSEKEAPYVKTQGEE